MKKLFEDFHFIVREEENISAAEMSAAVNDLVKMDHTQLDCLVVVVLSHGAAGVVHGADGKAMSIRELTEPFRPASCPSLANKPKLFFIQACQGTSHQPGNDLGLLSVIHI